MSIFAFRMTLCILFGRMDAVTNSENGKDLGGWESVHCIHMAFFALLQLVECVVSGNLVHIHFYLPHLGMVSHR